ncbi:MAG: hypothetical protein KKA35_07775, partial [Proteobacteria bacterium]|nr:hypothetical protein [Pseudomonadota bacterium]
MALINIFVLKSNRIFRFSYIVSFAEDSPLQVSGNILAVAFNIVLQQQDNHPYPKIVRMKLYRKENRIIFSKAMEGKNEK